MPADPIHLLRRIGGRALREVASGADRLSRRVAPWAAGGSAVWRSGGAEAPGGFDYGSLWTPRDEGMARQLIFVDDDAAEFERTGRESAEGLAELIGNPAATVVDYGCGIGRVARYLAPHVGTLWAVDASSRMLDFARERLAGLGNVRFARSSGTRVPAIPAGSVDMVYSLLVLQHVEREDALLILREFRRMLRDGGRIHVTFPNLLDDAYLKAFLTYVETGEVANQSRARFYTPQEVERIVPLAGFEIVSVTAGPDVIVDARTVPA